MPPSRRSPATAAKPVPLVPATPRAPRAEFAPAKVNLTLRVLGRRRNGYHDIESLVVFAGIGDCLEFVPGGALKLAVRGPKASEVGRPSANLVLKAARALSAEMPGLMLGRFTLQKELPAAAGLGSGSADAAATLRLLAKANRLRLDDPHILKVACKIGADVPVCLDPRPRLMRGIGEILSEPLRIPKLSAVLVNPGVALTTKRVFARYDRTKPPAPAQLENRAALIPQWRSAFIAALANDRNDLEVSAIALKPVVATVLETLNDTDSCRLARMSGSGTTCFGLFSSTRAAKAAAKKISAAHPHWWVKATTLG
jgi:4-diphosphocytidyl-2-C-methyl-D-erythritol kinase